VKGLAEESRSEEHQGQDHLDGKVAGPHGSHDRALALFWEIALAAFQERADREARDSGGEEPMSTLLIEYRVEDFAGWKAVFDQDPMGRRANRVTGHRIYRDSDDPNHLMLSLEFPSDEDAKKFRKVLEPVWGVSGAAGSWVLHETEAATY
jgi:hypothetical protein